MRRRYAWNESNGRESAQKGRHEDRDRGEEEEEEEEEEDEHQGGCDSCINMTTFCQRFLPGTAILAIKQFAQIVAMILYQLLSQRKSPGQIAHTPRKPCIAVLCVINFWHLKKAFGKRHSPRPAHIYMPRRGQYTYSRMLFSTGHSRFCHVMRYSLRTEEMKSLSVSFTLNLLKKLTEMGTVNCQIRRSANIFSSDLHSFV